MANSLEPGYADVEFTDTVECGLMAWAPDGVYLAHTNSTQIIVRNTKDDMDVLNIFPLTEKVDRLEWSLDSSYLAAGSYTDGILRIYCCEDFSWSCTIEMGNEWNAVGMQDFCWSLNPTSHQLITTANDYYQLTVWTLMDRDEVHRIKKILPTPDNKSFTTDGKTLAVAKFCPQKKYSVGIYDTNTWSQTLTFKFEANEFQGLKWCPDGTSILIWDSKLYSTWYMYSPSGDLLKRSSPDGLSLGIHTIEWSPTGQLFAFTNHSNKIKCDISSDENILILDRIVRTFNFSLSQLKFSYQLRILNGHMTFVLLMECYMTDNLFLDFPDGAVFLEELFECNGRRYYDYHLIVACEYLPNQELVSSPRSSDDIEEYSTKIGFSEGGYLATWTSKFPKKLWIWDLQNVSLWCTLVQRHNIKDFAWAPEGNMICLCTGGDCIYFWSAGQPAFAKLIPQQRDEDDFNANFISWNQNANAVAVSSDKLTVCHVLSQ